MNLWTAHILPDPVSGIRNHVFEKKDANGMYGSDQVVNSWGIRRINLTTSLPPPLNF